MVLNTIKTLWERHKRTEKIRKQMRMTRRCSRELDILLGMIGVDYSTLEPCPFPVEMEESSYDNDSCV